MKKTLVVLGAIVLGPVLLIGLVALAAGDWHPIGATSRGDRVSVSSMRVLGKTQRSALVRVEFKEPAHLPQGGPFVEMRARVRFNCANGSAAPSTEWFYSRDRSGRVVVSKKAKRDDDFGKDAQGNFGEMVTRHVCQQK